MIVDIHNHILYGVDDGPQTPDETILLAKQAVASGIHHVIATPHHKHRHKHAFYENDYRKILILVEEVNILLQNQGVPLTVYPGIEFHLHDQIEHDIEYNLEHFLTLNNTGKYLLIEPPCSYLPTNTEEVLLELKRKGYSLILAHPERNKILRRYPEKIFNMVRQGILMQVTASSLLGKDGKRLQNFSRYIFNHNLVHLIASDAHHFSRRKFELVSAYNWIEENYTASDRSYFMENAAHILDGSDINMKEPKFIKRKLQYFFVPHQTIQTEQA